MRLNRKATEHAETGKYTENCWRGLWTVHVDLATHECESLAEFEKEAFELMKQIGFEFPFVERLFKCKEVEDVRIFQDLADKIGLRSRQEAIEIRDGFTLSAMGLRLDHGEEHIAAPAVGESLGHVPNAVSRIIEFVHEKGMMTPRNRPED